MFIRISLFYLIIASLCLPVAYAGAGERKEADQRRNIQSESEGRIGTINSVDSENNLLVIDDLKFSYPPQQLIIYERGNISSLKALQPGQQVRYSNMLHLPSGSGYRVISEIWID